MERTGFGVTQSCGNMGSVDVSVLRWCMWLGPWSSGVVLCMDFLCTWQVLVSVYCAERIVAHLRCTQCSNLLNHIDISGMRTLLNKNSRKLSIV